MLKINLISETQKNEANLRQIYKFIKKFSFFTISLVILITSSFFFSEKILSKNYSYLKSEEQNVSNNFKKYNERVKTINDKISGVEKIQSEFIPTSNFFPLFSKIIPIGVTINSLNLSPITKSIRFTGVAKDRESLLNFKSNLENNTLISGATLPLKNILEKENISFDITGQVNATLLEKNIQ